jgi:hypothetical protein
MSNRFCFEVQAYEKSYQYTYDFSYQITVIITYKKVLEAIDSNAFYLLYSNIAQGSHKTGSVHKSSSLL